MYHGILIFSHFSGSDVQRRSISSPGVIRLQRGNCHYVGHLEGGLVEQLVSYQKGSISNCLDQETDM